MADPRETNKPAFWARIGLIMSKWRIFSVVIIYSQKVGFIFLFYGLLAGEKRGQ